MEESEYFLIETMADKIMRCILEDPLVERVRVEVDKPYAIKCADSTAVEVSFSRRTAGATAKGLSCSEYGSPKGNELTPARLSFNPRHGNTTKLLRRNCVIVQFPSAPIRLN